MATEVLASLSSCSCSGLTGEINYHKVFSCLEETGYQGLIGFELIPETTTENAVKAIMTY